MTSRKFQEICLVDITSLLTADLTKIRSLSAKKMKHFKSAPRGSATLAAWFGDADCALISRNISVDARVLEACPNLKYIGVYGTGLDQIDLRAARKRGIVVAGIGDYCNRETAEFVLAQIYLATRSLGPLSLKAEPQSVQGTVLGVVGMGRVGQELALLALANGLDVFYFSAARNRAIEGKGVGFLPLKKLMRKCEIISFHTPPDRRILSKSMFSTLPDGKLLISTSHDGAWDDAGFAAWIKNPKNMVVFDALAADSFQSLRGHRNVVLSKRYAYLTRQSRERRSMLLVKSLCDFLKKAK